MAEYGGQLDVYEALGLPAPPVPPSPREQALIAWLAGYDSVHTRRAYRRDLDVWFAWCDTQGVDVMAARRAHVDVWARAGAGYTDPKPRSLARRLAAVSAWYGWLIAEELAGHNPAAHTRRPRIDRLETPTRGLDHDEAKAMLTMSRHGMPKRDGLIVGFGLLLGFRRSAIKGLDVTDLGYDRGHRTVTYTAKGGAVRTVPIPPVLAGQIDDYLNGRTTGPLLVTDTGNRVSDTTIWRTVTRCAVLAGLPDPESVTPHSLRHGFATLALDLGASPRDVQHALGHGDPRQVEVYDHARGKLEKHPTYRVAASLD